MSGGICPGANVRIPPIRSLNALEEMNSELGIVRYSIVYTVVQKMRQLRRTIRNYDPVQSILIIFSKLFVNDHKSCLVVKFSTSPHICCHYTL